MSTNYRLVLQKIWEESFPNCGRISSARKALDCRAGGGGFDPQGQTNTQGLKIAEKWSYSLCTVLHCGSNDHIKWRSGDVKVVSPISTLLLNTLTLFFDYTVLSHLSTYSLFLASLSDQLPVRKTHSSQRRFWEVHITKWHVHSS